MRGLLLKFSKSGTKLTDREDRAQYPLQTLEGRPLNIHRNS